MNCTELKITKKIIKQIVQGLFVCIKLHVKIDETSIDDIYVYNKEKTKLYSLTFVILDMLVALNVVARDLTLLLPFNILFFRILPLFENFE